MSVRPSQRAKFNLSPTESNPVNTNPLGLLIVLKNASRQKPSIGVTPADGDRSDDNETSAFSYSSDDDSDEDNEDRQAYLSHLGDEYLLALSLEKRAYQFEPCRKLKAVGPKRKDRPTRKNVYKRPKDEVENSPGKTPVAEESRPTRHWTPPSSWSALGRLFGKLKHGHARDEDQIRKLSLQANSSAAGTDGASEESYRARSSSYGDPTAFLKQVELLSATRTPSVDVSHLKVVSRNADDLQFTVTNTKDSLAVCKEYFSRLTCYDTIPNVSQVVAVDVRTPIEEVINILRRHHTLGAVMWNSSATWKQVAPAQRVCDIGSIVTYFWPYFTDVASACNVSECVRRPIMDFLTTSQQVGRDENKSIAFETGVSAELSLIEAARLFCRQTVTNIPSTSDQCPGQHGRYYGRFLLPIVNDLTGDVIHVLSVNDILRYLSKELCKFDLTSAFDHTTISEVPRFSQLNTIPQTERCVLYLDNTLKQATAMLIESQSGVLPVFSCTIPSKTSYVTMLSIADVVDLVAKAGYCSDVVLSKSLAELVTEVPKRDVPFFEVKTEISKVLKTVAGSNCDHASWDSLLPAAIVVDDKGEFAGFLESEDLLTIVLSLDKQEMTNGGDSVNRSSRDRRDSGVGDEELLFPDDTLDLSV